MSSDQLIINDVTGLNPVAVWAVTAPKTVDEVQAALRQATGPVSIGGGRFSMGGQTASPGSLHIDMRGLNNVVSFMPEQKLIRVQAGIRWCDIQRFVDPHNLAVKIMQSYANFTVGGSLSVNCHGRYVGLGPLILSVNSLAVLLLSGELVEASPRQNSELFYAVVGGYGGLGVIVEAELQLAANVRVLRRHQKMPVSGYLDHFRKHVRHSRDAVFHNADIYPPKYTRMRSVTWSETDKPVTEQRRLQQSRKLFLLEAYFMWVISELPLGKWRRQHLIERIGYSRKKIHWRNYEAGYDVAEIEPASRKRRTYVLQEYFVPIGRFDEFVSRMADILKRYRVNMINVSVRHALPDSGSLLAWARDEVFAFVLYYKQRVRENAKQRVAVWTRELIDAALDLDGTYYLPYQPHATSEQFHRAYPQAQKLFSLKQKYDPEFRLRNVLWDKYYTPEPEPDNSPDSSRSEFHSVYSKVQWRDGFYRFLQTVFRLQPEDRMHQLIIDACQRFDNDEAIYRDIQANVASIRPLLSDLTFALPALLTQKRVMQQQTLKLLGNKTKIDGYVEIGSPGRYLSSLKKHVGFSGPVYLVDENQPGHSPVDWMERGGLRKIGRYLPLDNYRPFSPDDIADASIDLVTCYIGLHHIDPERLSAYIESIARVLRPGGLFILRDHDVPTPQMDVFVSLVHTVFNAGTGMSWEDNAAEPRYFNALTHWIDALNAHGLKDSGQRLLQAHDPSANTLMLFCKASADET